MNSWRMALADVPPWEMLEVQLVNAVAPFILRGASLLGIDSGYIGDPYRSGVWQHLASDMKPRHLAAMTRHIPFADLPAAFDDYIQGRVKGRVAVTIAN